MMEPVRMSLPEGLADTSTGMSTWSRRLSELPGCFADEVEVSRVLVQHDPIIYTVVESKTEGIEELLTGWCILYPGHIGAECHMTRGHVHRLPRAEMYYCISGEGKLLIQKSKRCLAFDLRQGEAVYVPAGWLHRHMNTGQEPLVTFFAVQADAGHDYAAMQREPFESRVLVDPNGEVYVHARQ